MDRSFMLSLAMLTLVLSGCQSPKNPLLEPWNTPFEVPPFSDITTAHYMPAFEEGMRLDNEEIRAIAENPEAPSFANTIEALDRSGSVLGRVNRVFSAMNSSMTNDDLQRVARDLAPVLSKHRDEILLNDRLFQRVKTVYDAREGLSLTDEQRMLLTKLYRMFARGGALLDAAKKEQLTKINEELSLLQVKFGEHTLAENNSFELVIDTKADLAGLPDGVIAAAAETANDRKHPGAWVFTLHKPSMIPFLQYADNRALREKIYTAYINRGNHNDSLDNKAILARIVLLRQKRAELLGYANHAAYVLEENMAKQPKNVYALLQQLWTPALRRAKAEVYDMQKIIDREKGGFTLAPWDWWYYAEKVKKAQYDLDETMLRPYFELNRVRQAVFDVATRLYGIQFVERTDIPGYHQDVKVFEVKEATGEHVGILYVDYFPRPSKEGGAWMGNFREQSKRDGKRIAPVIYNVGNFTKPTGDGPSLLSVDEVNTLFHEFGHALHGLLSDCTYETVSGTAVPSDFVELCSQVMENWAFEPEVLRQYARHYKTGEVIPEDLIKKISRADKFNQGFVTVEYLAASFLDMDWHTAILPDQVDVLNFEGKSMGAIGLIPEIVPRYRSSYFNHIFSGGYSAGYYSYIWAAVLDADAFQAFKDAGNLFDPATAKAFRENILARGGSEEGMVLYRKFRGKEPSIEPLLERRGLN
jgi:peptidyl-dipeptidase Dcp